MEFKLRNHQEQASDKIIRSISKGEDISIGMPIGTGKTIIALSVCKHQNEVGLNCHILVLRKELVHETISLCDEMGINTKDKNKPITTVSTVHLRSNLLIDLRRKTESIYRVNG